MIAIPEGWRELKSGETIRDGDLISPMGVKPFKKVVTKIGRCYKVDSGFHKTSIAITRIVNAEKTPPAPVIEPPQKTKLQLLIENWRPLLPNVFITGIDSPFKRLKIQEYFKKYFNPYMTDWCSGRNFYYLKRRGEFNFYDAPMEHNDAFSECISVGFDQFFVRFGPPDLNRLKYPLEVQLVISIGT